MINTVDDEKVKHDNIMFGNRTGGNGYWLLTEDEKLKRTLYMSGRSREVIMLTEEEKVKNIVLTIRHNMTTTTFLTEDEKLM